MARGLGTRMRAASSEARLTGGQENMAAKGIKGMIDVGRPFLDHVISEAADAGIRQVYLVIGPEHVEIRDYYTQLPTRRVNIDFVIQPEARGTGDALHVARDAVGDRRFLLLNSDNFYHASVLTELTRTTGNALAGFSRAGLIERGNIPPERVGAFALIEESDGWLTTIHEKPDASVAERLGAAARISMNCYVFTPRIFDFTGSLKPSPRGEYELPDAVRAAVSAGESFAVVPTSEGVLDLSQRGDVASVVDALAGHEVRL